MNRRSGPAGISAGSDRRLLRDGDGDRHHSELDRPTVQAKIECMRHAVLLVALAALPLVAPPANEVQPGVECDLGVPAHAPPEVPSWDSQAPFVTIYDWSESRATVPLGVGHVMRVSAFWWGGGHVRLPLHEQAGAEPWGWFADGWLVETGAKTGALPLIATARPGCIAVI